MKKIVSVVAIICLVLACVVSAQAAYFFPERGHLYANNGVGHINIRGSASTSATVILYADNDQYVNADRYDSSVDMFHLLSVAGTNKGNRTTKNGWCVHSCFLPDSEALR